MDLENRVDAYLSDEQKVNAVSSRVAVMQDGIQLTAGDRNQQYGDPILNLSLQATLYNALKSSQVVDRGLAHDAALMHVCAKLARIASSPGPLHRDNYVDGATYIAIAYECAERDQRG